MRAKRSRRSALLAVRMNWVEAGGSGARRGKLSGGIVLCVSSWNKKWLGWFSLWLLGVLLLSTQSCNICRICWIKLQGSVLLLNGRKFPKVFLFPTVPCYWEASVDTCWLQMQPLTCSVILAISFIDIWGAELNVYLIKLTVLATISFLAVVCVSCVKVVKIGQWRLF